MLRRSRQHRSGLWGSGLWAAAALLVTAGAGTLLLHADSADFLAGFFYDTLPPDPHDPAIDYFGETTDPIAQLQQRIAAGEVSLDYADRAGFLASFLQALNIDISSQVVVFSKTSLQRDLIEPANPRTIFFNDQVAVAWMYGGFIEIASQDPRKGVIYYQLEQAPGRPRFTRETNCLGCHEADLGVAGMLSRTQVVSAAGDPLLIYGGDFSTHRTAFEGRWGGWYVTGIPASTADRFRHLGNAMLTDLNSDDPSTIITPETISVATLKDKFDTSHYLSPYSDAAALLVFDHQMHMMNLLVRAGWEARVALERAESGAAEAQAKLKQVIEESAAQVADYMLFTGETPLPAPLEDTSGFREDFAARGPVDARGRTLRQIDAKTRLMRYPLSYMIYAPAFDALPTELRAAIYERLWNVLTGSAEDADDERYAHLDAPTRAAIVEIVRDTKADLPDYWTNR